MIVISNPTSITNEIQTINILFEEGLDLLHIRKPDFSEIEMAKFIHQIKMDFRGKLVLHSHHQLASDFGINRIQNPKRDIIPDKVYNSDWGNKNELFFSTSTHSIEEFNALSDVFNYAFLSPVFPSISKEKYKSETDLFEAIKKRTNYNTKLIALGGITSDKIKTTLEFGFDDVALLGTIWNTNNPIENFKLCQKIVLSY
jgi:thiamine-phosphate pyrophosphorylase